MDHTLFTLVIAAASLGVLHTLMGPDHYLPFIAISGARKWTVKKTAWVTGICGFIHIALAFLIGILGLRLGEGLFRLKGIEGFMSSIFGWLLISVGILYLVIGIRKIVGSRYSIKWLNRLNNASGKTRKGALIPWLLFIIFVFGPCEPLVPILLVPAEGLGISGLILITSVFGISTILTMLVLVLVPKAVISKVKLNPAESYLQLIAGSVILFCGIGVQFLGL